MTRDAETVRSCPGCGRPIGFYAAYWGEEGKPVPYCSRECARTDALREAAHALLDTCERGDGYLLQERMAAIGRLLGLARYCSEDA